MRRCATPTEIERAARLAGLHDFIAALPHGYDTPIGERGLKLSGGERQRIAIARAILRDPEIFVFDEATSMLDGPTERTILRNLRQISAGRTTITIAHRLSAIQDADLIAVLGDGRVIEQGDHATLLARDGAYAAMWRAQQAAVQACQRG
jgi:ATP-binding cassette subfamily B protein